MLKNVWVSSKRHLSQILKKRNDSIMKYVTVANTDLQIVEHNKERVLTTDQLAQIYECGTDNIKRNFSNNKEHFEEGKHFFKLEGDELKDLRGKNIHLQTHHKRTACLLLSLCALDVYLQYV